MVASTGQAARISPRRRALRESALARANGRTSTLTSANPSKHRLARSFAIRRRRRGLNPFVQLQRSSNHEVGIKGMGAFAGVEWQDQTAYFSSSGDWKTCSMRTMRLPPSTRPAGLRAVYWAKCVRRILRYTFHPLLRAVFKGNRG